MNATQIPVQVKKELQALASKEKAKQLKGFFKTRKGEYAEGDKFLGVNVPDQRAIAKKYYSKITLGGISHLLNSVYHEVRHTALLMLVSKMEKTKNPKTQEAIAKCYLKNIDSVNNWDLVDVSAPNILGCYLFELEKDRGILYEFAASNDIWKQRIAILSTFYFIKKGQLVDTLALSEMLLDSPYELVHKSVGWMLREVGKRDQALEKEFLDKYAATMPRISLRYAIEHFSDEDKKHYMELDK